MVTLTVETLQPYIGRLAWLIFTGERQASREPLLFEIRILDVKGTWGVVRALVEPVAGSGQWWVGADRLRFD